MIAAVGSPLDDRALQDVDQSLHRDLGLRELLADHHQRGSGRPADPQGQVPGVAPHHGHEEPLPGGRRVLHEVLDEILAEVDGGHEAEGRHVLGQRQVVVDGLGHVDHGQAPFGGGGHARGREGGVVAADGEHVGDVEPPETLHDPAERGRRAGRVGPGRAEDRAPVEVDPGRLGDQELLDVVDVAFHEPAVALDTPEDAEALVPGLDRGGGDDRVDAGSRAAPDQDGQRPHVRRAGGERCSLGPPAPGRRRPAGGPGPPLGSSRPIGSHGLSRASRALSR